MGGGRKSFWNWGFSRLPEIDTCFDLNFIFSKETAFEVSFKAYTLLAIHLNLKMKLTSCCWKI